MTYSRWFSRSKSSRFERNSRTSLSKTPLDRNSAFFLDDIDHRCLNSSAGILRPKALVRQIRLFWLLCVARAPLSSQQLVVGTLLFALPCVLQVLLRPPPLALGLAAARSEILKAEGTIIFLNDRQYCCCKIVMTASLLTGKITLFSCSTGIWFWSLDEPMVDHNFDWLALMANILEWIAHQRNHLELQWWYEFRNLFKRQFNMLFKDWYITGNKRSNWK